MVLIATRVRAMTWLSIIMSNLTQKAKNGKKVVSKGEVKQIVKSMLREVQELKVFIVQGTATSVDYAGFVQDMSAITQGDSDITRDGDRVQLMEWTFKWVAEVGDTYNLMRVILFQYIPDSNLGTPLVTNIIQTNASVNGPISYKSIDYVKQIYVLYDRVVHVNTYHPIEINSVVIRKFHDKQMQFTGATTRTNGLYFMVISDSAAATHPKINYYSTIRFTDS